MTKKTIPFRVIKIQENNSVGIGITSESIFCIFETPNPDKRLTAETVQMEITDDSIKTHLKLSPQAAEALFLLLWQELHK